jgi:hypothetical protein
MAKRNTTNCTIRVPEQWVFAMPAATTDLIPSCGGGCDE